MTETLNRTGAHKIDRTTFAGEIYQSDFNTSHANGNIVSRIARDACFDRWCKKNMANKSKYGGIKND